MKILRADTIWGLSLLLLIVSSNPAAAVDSGNATVSTQAFHTLNVQDGLTDNFIRNIQRDSYGYVWFSTINGISRYDGYSFRNYMPLQMGGRANDVSAIKETADSTLWMVCAGELFTYSRAIGNWRKNGMERLAQLDVKGAMKLFYVDDRRNLWVTTEYGLFHYDYSQRKLLHIQNYSKSPITHIVSKNGNTVVVNADYKIFQVVPNTSRLSPLTTLPNTQQPTTNAQLPHPLSDRDSRVYLDNDLNLWVYNAHSAPGSQWIFSLKTHQWQQPADLKQMGDVLVNVINEDNNGNLWVGTGDAGIFVFACHDGKYTRISNMKAFMPRSSHITNLYLDDNNTMWIGSAKLGIAFTDMNSPNFDIVSTGDCEDVSSFIQDRQGNLWIAFDGDGIIRKSPTGAVTHFSASRGQLPSNIVTSFALLPDGTLLMGTYGSGIAKFDGYRFTPVYTQCSKLKYIKAMAADTHGDLWIATVDKGVVKVCPNGKTANYNTSNSPLASNGILCLAVDSLRDIIYIGTSMGVSAFDGAKQQFVQNPQLQQLNGSYVSSLMVCDQNRLWIGSRNGLWVYLPNENAIQHFTTNEGMSHNAVRALVSSGNNVWASTDNGLTCISQQLSPNTQQPTILPFIHSDGLNNVIFSNNAAITAPDGSALLGSFSGYIRIQPEDFITHYPKIRVQYTDYRINGERPVATDSSTAKVFFASPDSPVPSVVIRHNDRIGIAVSAMVPTLSNKIKYLYRFKGEKQWSGAPDQVLYFPTLKPGNHTLQVKALLPGLLESETAELHIKVMPPFYLSNLAIFIYLLLLAAIVWFLVNLMRRRQKRELAMKQLELNLEKYQIEEEKIRFFTNISHDLKTPLTLVVAPLEKIRASNLPSAIRTEVDVAWRNARQLHDLVLQLLDFRRLDVGREKLNLRHGDIVGFVRQTVQSFNYYAMNKQINMQLDLPPTPVEINFDEDKMRRVITNLLSNAFKYNTENGTVNVSLDVQPSSFVLSVADTGIGINDKQHVFDRFMQERPKGGDGTTGAPYTQGQEGSGLGLHIVKQYVQMMEGTIHVADNKPRGTIFTVKIPIKQLTIDNEQLAIDNTSSPDAQPSELSAFSEPSVPEKATILVVDDNMDARQFLQRSLDDEYHVLLAANGKEALHQLSKNDNVNIVVSDVMMPVMDGIALFRNIKSNINYSHIPVILLTAKSSEESIVAGLEEGADDYITKPFSLAVLRLRIRKILDWTQRAHTSVARGLEIKPSDITVSSLDEELISNAIAHIEAHMHDADYSVMQLSSDVGMTRGHLYKTLMAITGKSPLEFIRIIKLKRGKSLLDQGKTNISEVADMVGFSPKQFAHYFKLMYNDTPSEYLKKRKQTTITQNTNTHEQLSS